VEATASAISGKRKPNKLMNQMQTEKPNNYGGQLTSPDLRFRTSRTIWGPLRLEVLNHREGTEKGYEAGQVAYEEESLQGLPTLETLDMLMGLYLRLPRYRPRTCTQKIIDEWRAMFVLGWTSQILASTSSVIQPTRENNGGNR
jgi:hypothetical protein